MLSTSGAIGGLPINRGTALKPTKVYIPKQPLRVTREAIKHLSALSQFHGISDETLIRLAERRTRLNVPDRWVAIALILGNRVPIPLPGGKARPRWQAREATVPAKLELIQGGRIVR